MSFKIMPFIYKVAMKTYGGKLSITDFNVTANGETKIHARFT